MRFVFCVVIIVYHGRNLGGTPEIALFADAGHIGVEFFFMVSGFLMAKSAARRETAGCDRLGQETVLFLWNKIRPILFFYLTAAVFSYGQIALENGFTLRETIHNLMLGVWDLLLLRASGIGTFGLVGGTWYLSAMYLAMLILYPMLRVWKERFVHIIAPLIGIFGLGYLSRTYGHLNQYVNNWDLLYSGMIRALAEISLGCVCYVVCQRIRSVRVTPLSRVLITLVQIAGYGGVIWYTTELPVKQFDFVMVLWLAVCVTLSFSGQGIGASLFSGSLFPWLGKMSMVIYLNHMWVKNTIAWLLPESWGYRKLMLVYMVGVAAVSLAMLLLETVLNAFWTRYGKTVRGWLVQETKI